MVVVIVPVGLLVVLGFVQISRMVDSVAGWAKTTDLSGLGDKVMHLLRPILVPRDARLNPALMLLSVFAGIAMFGAWGIVIGPVLMILIVTTVDVYLAVYKGVDFDVPDEKPARGSRFRLRKAKAGATQSIAD